MPEEKTVADTVRRLEREGYTDDFRAEEGVLRALRAERRFSPEELRIDGTHRFEGVTDPADETVVFALRAADGLKGTYVVAYGPQMDPSDADVVRRLEDAR